MTSSKSFKILFVSDWHLTKNGTRFIRTKDLSALCASGQYDLLVHGGDLVDPTHNTTYAEGLQRLREITGDQIPIVKVAGNNDIEAVYLNDNIAEEYIFSYMSQQCNKNNITLLDNNSLTMGGIRFVGNYMGYDGSLFCNTMMSNGQTAAQHMEQETAHWVKMGLTTTPQEMFTANRAKLLEQLDRDLHTPTIIVTHTVPTPKMVLYEISSKYDQLNTFMGWDEASHGNKLWRRPNVFYHLSGHVHRNYEIRPWPQLCLLNASNQEGICSLQIRLDNQGQFEMGVSNFVVTP